MIYYTGNLKKAMLSLRNKIWNISFCNDSMAFKIMSDYNIPLIIARIIVARNITDIPSFLDSRLKTLLKDPYTAMDMEKAVLSVADAITNNRRILLWGDYDVDGICSVSILIRFFQDIDFRHFDYHIPDRKEEGYGLAGYDYKKFSSYALVLSLDCGTSDIIRANEMKSNGVTLVIIDHHTVTSECPDVPAFVNPKRIEDNSDYHPLCAAGLAFIFVIALNRHLKNINFINNIDTIKYVPLACIATVCDVVPLIGINRAIVRTGISLLDKTIIVGLRALINICKIKKINTYSIGFLIGPRLNAAGRIANARKCVELMVTDDPDTAQKICIDLNLVNEQRKRIEEEIFMQAMEIAETQSSHEFIFVIGDDWDIGVIGIIASRITEKFSKPCAVISFVNNTGRASARSTNYFDLGAAINKCKHLLESGGGHSKAAGFTVTKENLIPFQKAILEIIDAQTKELITDNRQADLEIALSGVDDHLLDNLKILEPFGEGNQEPLFMIKNVRFKGYNIFAKKHIRTSLVDESGQGCDALLFNYANTISEPSQILSINYCSIICKVIESYTLPHHPVLQIMDIIPMK